LWTYAEFGYNPRLIAQNVAPSVQLNDSRADKALTEIFVGRTNDYLLHTVILRCFTLFSSDDYGATLFGTFDVTADGQRFLIAETSSPKSTAPSRSSRTGMRS
jgi:hypothetical protein